MTPDPFVVPKTTTVGQVYQMLRKNKIWSIFIGKSGKFDGIVTKKDLEKIDWKNNSSVPAYKIMSKPVFNIDQDTNVEEAKRLMNEKNINQIAVTAAGKHCGIVTKYDIRKFPQIEGANKSGKKFSVFVSHIKENENIANNLKSLIQNAFPNNVDVFVAGDSDNIPFSEDWFEKIKEGIHECDLMVILCTPSSVRRPWINFEAGAATLLKKKIGPVCFAGQNVGDLPSPLNYIRSQAIDCSDDEKFSRQINKFMDLIADKVDMPHPKIDVINSDFFRAVKSEKSIPVNNSPKVFGRAGIAVPEISETERRVIQNMAQSIFTPIIGIIESDRDRLKRGYDIEFYYLNHLSQNTNINQYPLKISPKSLLKQRVHDPDPVLQKYLEIIEGFSEEYNTYSERLEILYKNILKKKDIIWDEFLKLCNDLIDDGIKTFPNPQDYFSILALTIADAENLSDRYQMWDFYDKNRNRLRAFILDSTMKNEVLDYNSYREKFYPYSDEFLQVLTELKHDWMKTYSFLEGDLQPKFNPAYL